jgi:hypothetical protein
MLEKLASDVLNSYLGQYVENVSRDKLNIQIWKGMLIKKKQMVYYLSMRAVLETMHFIRSTMCTAGEVDLLGLSLKRAALDTLDLPIDVKEGIAST